MYYINKRNSMKTLCPHCGKEINIGYLLGKRTSKKKAKTSAENGLKGGRPKNLNGGRPKKKL